MIPLEGNVPKVMHRYSWASFRLAKSSRISRNVEFKRRDDVEELPMTDIYTGLRSNDTCIILLTIH